MLNTAVEEMRDADIAIIIGTSLQVYPAASLIGFVPDNCNVYYVDPKPHMSWELKQRKNLEVIEKSAGIGVVKLVYEILS
jgi:NAD-dependent deacetylase